MYMTRCKSDSTDNELKYYSICIEPLREIKFCAVLILFQFKIIFQGNKPKNPF